MKRIVLITLAAMALSSCSSPKEPASKVSFDDVITSRRSIRSYDPAKTITEEEVRALLKATQEAPSWANQQPTKYYVAIGDEKRQELLGLLGGSNPQKVKDAPVLIVSTFETGKSGFFRGQAANEIGDGWGAYDNGASNTYLILCARAMGFDTLIMGIRDSQAIRQLFSIPENETVMAVISLGYRAGEPVRPSRRDLDEIAKFF